MLEAIISGFDQDLEGMRDIATAGFTVAFNVSVFGPEHLCSEFPQAWQDEYKENNYFAGDPVFLWAAGKQGTKRWSEIRIPDIRGLMKRARAHDLNYGLVCSLKRNGQRSFVTAARADREFLDTEIAEIQSMFLRWCGVVSLKK